MASSKKKSRASAAAAATATASEAASKASSSGSSRASSTSTSKAASTAASTAPFRAPSKAASTAPLSDGAGPPAQESVLNAAMEKLRDLKLPALGGSPATDTESHGTRGHHVRAMLVACLCSCAAGTTLGFASAAMPSIEHEPWYTLAKSPPENRWVVAVLLLGAFVGALLSGLPLWYLGNRRTLLLCLLLLAASWFALAVCNHTGVLLAARTACGLWLGLITIGSSLYVAEVAPSDKRAFFMGLTEVATSGGILACYALSGAPWRTQATVFALAPLPLLGARRVLVECPRWLLARGRPEEADMAATRLYGFHLPPELRLARRQKLDVKKPVPFKRHTRRLAACLLLHVLQGATCAPLFFCQAIQSMSHLVKDMERPWAAIITTSMHVSFVALFGSLTRITGRRELMVVSASLEVFCFVVFPPFEHLALSQWLLTSDEGDMEWSFVYSMNLVVLSYSVGLCHTPALFTAELCSGPGWLRHIGAPLAWATRWLFLFLLVQFNDPFLDIMLRKYSNLVAAATIAVLVCVLAFLLPETEGRTLTDIELAD